jgi:hypothetical protein
VSSAPLDSDVEPVVGWRGWFLRLTSSGPELAPAGWWRVGWPSLEPMTARCSAGRGHRSPDPGCDCGLYAFRSGTALRSFKAWFPVIGTVSMWGRIVEHEHGWRAEHAYPDRLRLICETCLRTRTTRGTGIPVVAGTSSKGAASQVSLSAWCATHVPAGLDQTWPAPEVSGALLARYAVDVLPVERIESVIAPRRKRRSRWSLDHVDTTNLHFDPPGIVRRLR